MRSNIEQALFALESVAHLQGMESELLPLVDAARADMLEAYDFVTLSALHESVAPGGEVFAMLRQASRLLGEVK